MALTRKVWAFALAASLSAGSLACSREEPAPPAPSAPWPAPALAPSAEKRVSRRVRYVLEPQADIRFEVPARELTARGQASVVRGHLDVDLANLAATRGNVEVDLASIVMDGDGGYTATALDWLEAESDRHRWARFSIVRIDAASMDAAEVGQDVDLVAFGELEVHGYRVERAVRLRASFEPLSRIAIRTRKPLSVSLRAHDIKPRSAAELGLLGTKLGHEARVEIEIAARKAP